MKHKQTTFIFLVLILFLTPIFTGCKKQPDKITWSTESIQNIPGDPKMVMIDFYGVNCNPCKKLNKETFSDPRVIAFMNQHFRCYKINAWAGTGNEYRKKYNIISVPTLVFQDKNGQIIDYLKSFIPPNEFLSELERIVAGKETVPNLKAQLAREPENPDLIYKMARKMAAMARWEEELRLWKTHTRLTPPGTENHDYGRVKIAGYDMWTRNDFTKIIPLLDSLPNYDFVFPARSWVWEHLRRTKEYQAEADYYSNSMKWLVENQRDYPDVDVSRALGRYAWRMGRLGLYLEDALKMNTHALKILPANCDPHQKARILDSQAELFWILGKKEEALKAINQSLTLWPERRYFHDQKQKFLTRKYQKKTI